jgi:uncharacterized protein
MNDGVSNHSNHSPTTRILWRSDELGTAERFTGARTPDGWRLDGLVVLPIDHEPAQVTYRVEVDSRWRTRRAEVTIERHGEARRVTFEADGAGAWTVDGAPADALAGSLDVDLGFTPATNTLTIRRLTDTTASDPVALGETRTVSVAWMPFPELDVRPNEQSYTRLAPDRWLYHSGDFTAEIAVDPDGYVLRYGDDMWTAVLHRDG